MAREELADGLHSSVLPPFWAYHQYIVQVPFAALARIIHEYIKQKAPACV